MLGALSENHKDHVAGVDGDRDLPAVGDALHRLVAGGLGPVVGLSSDWRRRSAISRVARLGRVELASRLDVVYGTYRSSFVGYATRILGNRHDAEDVVNEAFVRVLRADPDLQAPEALAGYARTVVRNVARDHRDETTRDHTARQPHAVVDLDARLAGPDRPLEDRVCDEVTLGIAFRLLSDRQRQCFALRFVEGLSVKDSAARMGVSEGNVKRITFEVRARLSAALAAA